MGAAVILAAVFESAFGIARLGKLCEHVEEPVIAGFLNAFAVFLLKSQVVTTLVLTHTVVMSSCRYYIIFPK